MSFFCLLLYLIATFLRPQDWWPAMYNWRIVNTLAYAIIFFLMVERLAAKKNLMIKVPQNWLMAGMFASILMSHIVHTYFAALVQSFNMFLINFIFYFIILNGINTEKKFKVAIWTIVILIFILVPQGIYQINNGFGWAGQPLTFDFHRDEYRINWIGIFNDPNDLALTFMIDVGIVLSFMFGKTGLVQRLISMTAIGYLFYGVFLTNSRGGMVALMVTVVFYFIRRTRKFVLGGIIGGICVMGIVALGPSRMAIISTDEDSANTRVHLWYEGIEFFKTSPIFGIGFNRFYLDSTNMQSAHNSYIMALSETGMVGLFFWIALIVISFKGLSLVQQYDPGLKTYAMGLQSGLVGFSAAAFFLTRNYVILPYLLFALSGALVNIARQRHPELKYEFTRKDVKNTILLGSVLIGLAYVIIKRTL